MLAIKHFWLSDWVKVSLQGWPWWAKRRRKIMIRGKEEEVWDLIKLMEVLD